MKTQRNTTMANITADNITAVDTTMVNIIVANITAVDTTMDNINIKRPLNCVAQMVKSLVKFVDELIFSDVEPIHCLRMRLFAQ